MDVDRPGGPFDHAQDEDHTEEIEKMEAEIADRKSRIAEMKRVRDESDSKGDSGSSRRMWGSIFQKLNPETKNAHLMYANLFGGTETTPDPVAIAAAADSKGSGSSGSEETEPNVKYQFGEETVTQASVEQKISLAIHILSCAMEKESSADKIRALKASRDIFSGMAGKDLSELAALLTTKTGQSIKIDPGSATIGGAKIGAKRVKTVSIQEQKVLTDCRDAAFQCIQGALNLNSMGHADPEIFDRAVNVVTNFGKQLYEARGIAAKIAQHENMNGPVYLEDKSVIDGRCNPFNSTSRLDLIAALGSTGLVGHTLLMAIANTASRVTMKGCDLKDLKSLKALKLSFKSFFERLDKPEELNKPKIADYFYRVIGYDSFKESGIYRNFAENPLKFSEIWEWMQNLEYERMPTLAEVFTNSGPSIGETHLLWYIAPAARVGPEIVNIDASNPPQDLKIKKIDDGGNVVKVAAHLEVSTLEDHEGLRVGLVKFFEALREKVEEIIDQDEKEKIAETINWDDEIGALLETNLSGRAMKLLQILNQRKDSMRDSTTSSSQKEKIFLYLTRQAEDAFTRIMTENEIALSQGRFFNAEELQILMDQLEHRSHQEVKKIFDLTKTRKEEIASNYFFKQSRAGLFVVDTFWQKEWTIGKFMASSFRGESSWEKADQKRTGFFFVHAVLPSCGDEVRAKIIGHDIIGEWLSPWFTSICLAMADQAKFARTKPDFRKISKFRNELPGSAQAFATQVGKTLYDMHGWVQINETIVHQVPTWSLPTGFVKVEFKTLSFENGKPLGYHI